MSNTLNADVGSYGVAPAYQQVSDFQCGEAPALGGVVAANCIDITSLPFSMPKRKLYAWLWAANGGSNWMVQATINFFRQQSALGSLPMCIGGGTWGSQSLASVCSANGQNVQDCLGIYVANPTGTQPATLILQPLYITGQFDRITLSIANAQGVTAIRALLACISSGSLTSGS